MTTQLLKRNNFFDFKQISKEDLEVEQDFNMGNVAALANAVGGSGVVLDFPVEPTIFDSDALTEYQSGLVAINTFDGQGVLSEPYTCTDTVFGNQLAIALTDARVGGVVHTIAVVLGKTFDGSLIYETLEFASNTEKLTKNHFTEVTNLMFNNLRGNENTSIDGYGSFDVGGRLVVTEASSFRAGRGTIAAEQSLWPDLTMAYFKTSESSRSLHTELTDAIGTSNNIDDLSINTTTATYREFTEGASSELILAQKFQMRGNNIQKVSLALALESGSTWTGQLEIGIRPLMDTTSLPTDYLPDTQIGFDPNVNALEVITLTQADLLNQGIVLNQDYQIVDAVFSGTRLSNPNISGLIDGEYYAITIRRLGNTGTGTIITPESPNEDADIRLSVFDTGVWTDISDSTLWFKVWTSGAFVTSGTAYDNGTRVVGAKTEVNAAGSSIQKYLDNIPLADPSEDTENYIVLQNSEEFTDVISHPRTGDDQFNRTHDAPLISALEQDGVSELLDSGTKPIILARFRDRNAKNNPTITGTIDFPGLGIGNTIDIINPGSDLLVQNVVGSIITPNILKPTIKYKIIAQELITDLYGDLDGSGDISVDDSARLLELDGYAPDLNQGTVDPAIQLQAVLSGVTSVAELLRADLSDDGYITNSDDGYEISEYLNNGSAFTSGSSFSRTRLTVEPLELQLSYLDSEARSSLAIEDNDPDLINNTSFVPLDFQIDYIPNWSEDQIEVLDLRRYTTTTFIDFTIDDLQESTENGGTNALFIPGDIYLTGEIKNLDGTHHSLDFERNLIEFELPAGDTSGEINVFATFVSGVMRFSDGTLVSASAISNNQVRFEVYISSYAKDIDGYDYQDGYMTGDEVIGTYIDQNTGLFRLNCSNIKESAVFPQIRTRIVVAVNLKKAGFATAVRQVTSSQLLDLIS